MLSDRRGATSNRQWLILLEEALGQDDVRTAIESICMLATSSCRVCIQELRQSGIQECTCAVPIFEGKSIYVEVRGPMHQSVLMCTKGVHVKTCTNFPLRLCCALSSTLCSQMYTMKRNYSNLPVFSTLAQLLLVREVRHLQLTLTALVSSKRQVPQPASSGLLSLLCMLSVHQSLSIQLMST